VQVACAVRCIDFEGRADGQSVRSILQRVEPRKLVLVRGTPDSRERLRQHCLEALGLDYVSTPKDGETLAVAGEGAMYKVRLDEALLSAVNLRPMRDCSVAWVDATLARGEGGAEGDGEAEQQQKTAAEKAAPQFVLAPLHPGLPMPMAHAFVGDVRLSDFRQRLAGAGVAAEFSGAGALVCGAQRAVVVRKAGPDRLVLEGALCAEYYRVRNLLCDDYQL